MTNIYDARVIVRIGPTNRRFTKGNLYTVGSVYNRSHDGEIIARVRNDKGGTSEASITSAAWEVIKYQQPVEPQIATRQEFLDEVFNKPKEKAMKIENVTLVNGRRADGLTTDEYLKMIAVENERLQTLRDSKIMGSSAISRLITRHSENKAKLVALMDEHFKDK